VNQVAGRLYMYGLDGRSATRLDWTASTGLEASILRGTLHEYGRRGVEAVSVTSDRVCPPISASETRVVFAAPRLRMALQQSPLRSLALAEVDHASMADYRIAALRLLYVGNAAVPKQIVPLAACRICPAQPSKRPAPLRLAPCRTTRTCQNLVPPARLSSDCPPPPRSWVIYKMQYVIVKLRKWAENGQIGPAVTTSDQPSGRSAAPLKHR